MAKTIWGPERGSAHAPGGEGQWQRQRRRLPSAVGVASAQRTTVTLNTIEPHHRTGQGGC